MTETKNMFTALLVCLLCTNNLQAEGPTFSCKNKKHLHQIEVIICEDAELIALDRELAQVYQRALAIDKEVVHANLPVNQRSWISGRNECWKVADNKGCAVQAYDRRISELLVRYRLVTPTSKLSYSCEKNPAHEIIVSYFTTKIKIAVVEHGDDTFYLYDHSKGQGTHYLGRNESLSLKGRSVEFVAAYQDPVITCQEVEN